MRNKKDDLPEILEQEFGTTKEFYKLDNLWDQLCKSDFLYQEGPYPAGHGKAHTENLLSA
ncbi:MAG: hypothetical protein GY928_27455 [Colwellia sp.]|nr:hypothetical protein [Colwellia sp.]